jgi:hypothetical protein
MANKTLTQEQVEIIAKLESEFLALNKSQEDQPFSIIDINKLSAEINRFNNGRIQHGIQQKAIRQLTTQTAKSVAERLNADFEKGNLPFEAVIDSFDNNRIKVQAHNEGNPEIPRHSDYSFRIELWNDWWNTEFGTTYKEQILVRIRTNSGSGEEKYNSVEEALSSANTTRKLVKLQEILLNENAYQRYLWR